MKITCDREADALYFSFRETTVTTEHWAEGIAADYDSDARWRASRSSMPPVALGI